MITDADIRQSMIKFYGSKSKKCNWCGKRKDIGDMYPVATRFTMGWHKDDLFICVECNLNENIV